MAKSSAAAARDKARKAMLELQKQRAEKDARVQAQVEQFYVVADAVDAAAEKLAAAQAAHEQAQAEARTGQAQVVQALVAEQLGDNEIASLCGISVVQVRSLRRLASSAASSTSSEDDNSGEDAPAATGTDAGQAADAPATSTNAA